MASLDEAITRRSPSGATSMRPGGVDVEDLDAAVGEHRQQLHHVEVGHEGVGQLHQRPRHLRCPFRRISRHGSRPPLAPRCSPRWVRLVTRCLEPQGPRHHLLGDLGEGAVVAEGVGPQPDQRLADADLELGGDHARPPGARRTGSRRRPRARRPASPGGAFAWSTRTAWAAMSAATSASACCSAVRRPGRVGVQVERAEADGPHLQREPEDGPDARLDGGTGEREPSRDARGRPGRVRAPADRRCRRRRTGPRPGRTAAAR